MSSKKNKYKRQGVTVTIANSYRNDTKKENVKCL